MRVGLSVSSIGHGTLLVWALLGLPGASSQHLDRQQPLPIDVISMEEYTQITAGLRDAEEEAPSAAPEPPEEASSAERVTEEPPAREQSAAPEPAPPPPQARPDPEPAPVPEELRTAAIPPEPAPQAEPEPAPAPPRADAPMPRARPDIAPPPRQAERPEPPRDRERPPEPERPQAAPERPDQSFDPDRIAALLNRVPDSGGAVRTESPSERETFGRGMPSGSDERLSISDIDALRRQIAQCWNPPIGVLEADELVVRVGLELNPDGSLAASPRVLGGSSHPVFNIAAEAATRAVSRCEPYRLPAEKYHLWREIHVNFDPREMLGG